VALLASLEGQGWRLEIQSRTNAQGLDVNRSKAISSIKGPAVLRLFMPQQQELSITDGVASHNAILFENTDYDIYLTADRTASFEVDLPPAAIFRYKNEQVCHYSLNFRNDVGLTDIRVTKGKDVVQATLEVFPTKLDYRSDYILMRDDLASLARNLVLAINARTYATASPISQKKPTVAEWCALLKGYFASYKRLAESIIALPYTVLQRHVEFKPIDKVRRLDRSKLRNLLRRQTRNPSGVSRAGKMLPSKLPELNRRTIYDTSENRHVKYLLRQTSFRLQQIVGVEESGDEDSDKTAEQKFFEAFRPIAKVMLRDVERLLQNSFLKEIESSPAPASGTQVLQKHPTYSAFGRAARTLNGGLSATGGILKIGLKNIAELYEYWCFFKLVELLRTRFELVQQSIVKIKHTGVVVTLQKGKQAAVRFSGPQGKWIDLIYNRKFSNLPTLPQKPDNVMQLTDGRAFHILDAKYRIETDLKYCEQFGGVGPTTEDINTMHRYRDAIVLPVELGGGGFERGVVKDAVVLFPWHREEDFVDHRFFKSIAEVRIGGLPCLPNSTKLVEKHLARILETEGIISDNGGQDQS
jgi:predicted component of viral defense system (DUF524 family)